MLIIDKNVVINSVGSQTAVIWTHGGYTPKRLLRSGSGKTKVPNGITLYFHTPQDTVGAGEKARRYIEGTPSPGDMTVFQTKTAGQETRNYSLSIKPTDNKQFGSDFRSQCDIVTVTMNKKAHLADIWDAYESYPLALRWTEVRYFACRINKITYSGEVSGPAVDPELFFRIHGRYPD